MFTSLDWLVLVFIATTVASLLAICLMFFLKNPTAKKVAFYFLTAQGMLAAWMNAMSTPYSYLSEIIIGWGFGILSIVALLLVLLGKSEFKFKIAQILVTVSVIAGLLNAFVI